MTLARRGGECMIVTRVVSKVRYRVWFIVLGGGGSDRFVQRDAQMHAF